MTQKTLTPGTGLGKSYKAKVPVEGVALIEVNIEKAEQTVSVEHEKWLYNNPNALAEVKRGLADSAAGRGVKMSFVEFANIDIDE